MAWHRTLFLSVFLLLAAVAGWTAFQYPGVVRDLQGRAKGQDYRQPAGPVLRSLNIYAPRS